MDEDFEYINDYHKEWDKRCWETNRKTKSRHLSVEYLKEMCQRHREAAEKEFRESRKKRKKQQ